MKLFKNWSQVSSRYYDYFLFFFVEIYEILKKKTSIFSEHEKDSQNENLKLGGKNNKDNSSSCFC